MFSWFGLSQRLNIIIITINLLILLVVAFLANSGSAAVLRNQAVTRFNSKTQQAFELVNADLDDLYDLAQELADWAATYDTITISSSVIPQVVTRLGDDRATHVYSIGIVRPNGTALWVSPSTSPDMPELRIRISTALELLESDDFIRASETGHEWFLQSEAAYDTSKQATVTITIPYQHADGDGLVWVDMLQSTFDEIVLNALNARGLLIDTVGGYTLILDDEGQLISYENIRDQENLQFNVNVLLLRYADEQRSSDGLYHFGDPFNADETSLFSIAALSNGWDFITVLPENEIPVVPNNVYLPIIGVGILGIIILILSVNRYVAHAIVRPLNDLGLSASEIGQGNLRFEVSHQNKSDEVGQLASAMNSMRDRLQETYSELASWSSTLEDRVENRTGQLAEARQEAERTANQLRAIYDESLFVVNEAQLQTVLDAFIDRILQLLDSSYCAIWLLSDDRQQMRLVATNDIRRRIGTAPVIISANHGIVGQAIIRDRSIIVNNYDEYDHPFDLSAYYDNPHEPYNRAACAPLKFGGFAVGAVLIGRSANSAPYNLDEQRQLTLFTNIVSPSVRNAQLFTQLQAAVSDAERANEVKTRFLASVTHELRTPLNLIINNMDFMRVGAFGEVNDEQIDRLNQTVRSAEHLLYLINDLLDVSKIESGEMRLFIQESEVYTMLEDAIDNAYALLDNDPAKVGKIEIRIDIEEDMPEVLMDSRRIRQVLNNLLSNAIKFTQAGTVTLKVFKDNYGIHFSVHDTGMGIAADEMHMLFEAFVRTSAANEQAIEGTGLGLPISRYLIQQHNSDLLVTSEVNEGTTFAFSLPFNPKKSKHQKLNLSDTQEIPTMPPYMED